MPAAVKTKHVVRIPREAVEKQGGVVVLSLREYHKLRERAVPEYYLTGKAAEDLDKLVKEGLRDHAAGKTKKIKSLADLD